MQKRLMWQSRTEVKNKKKKAETFDNDYVTPATACKIVPSGVSPRQSRPFSWRRKCQASITEPEKLRRLSRNP